MMTAVIEVTGLTKRYGGQAVVDDISFHVDAGEIFGILGPNGADLGPGPGRAARHLGPDQPGPGAGRHRRPGQPLHGRGGGTVRPRRDPRTGADRGAGYPGGAGGPRRGRVPGAVPQKGLSGQIGTEYIASISVAIVLAVLGMTGVPMVIGQYRERGILRRLGVTPVRPLTLLLADLMVWAASAILSVALVIGVARVAYHVPAPHLA